ncbi:hypothetical protein ACTFIY_007129 [Dictyostelium cf. discoideum]
MISNSNKNVNLITKYISTTTSFTNVTIRYKTNLKEVKDTFYKSINQQCQISVILNYEEFNLTSFNFQDYISRYTSDISENGENIELNIFKQIKNIIGGIIKLPF